MSKAKKLSTEELKIIYELRSNNSGICIIVNKVKSAQSTVAHHLHKIDDFLCLPDQEKNFDSYLKWSSYIRFKSKISPYKVVHKLNELFQDRLDSMEDKISILEQHIEIFWEIIKEKQ